MENPTTGTEIQKTAWIDDKNRIVSFRWMPESRVYTVIETDFWPYIQMLVNAGYRIQ